MDRSACEQGPDAGREKEFEQRLEALEAREQRLDALEALLRSKIEEPRRPRWLRLPARRLTRATLLVASLVAALVPGLLFADFGYNDVTPGKFYYAAVGRLAAAPFGNDILGHCDPPARTLFCPDDFITRGQAAFQLDKAIGTDGIPKAGTYVAKAQTVDNGAITSAKLGTDAVTSTAILNGTIATADLGDGVVTAAKLSATGSADRQVLTSNGTTVSFQAAPSEIVSMTSANIAAPNPLPITGANYSFIGAKVTLNVAAGHIIHVSSSAALGSSLAGGANGLKINICKKGPGDVNPVEIGSDWYAGLAIPQAVRLPFQLDSKFALLPAGTTDFGICYQVTNTNWNSNDWTRTLVTVYTPTSPTFTSAPDPQGPPRSR